MNPQLLRDFPFFEYLDDEYLAEISKLCSERTYIKGESIFFEGDFFGASEAYDAGALL